MNQKVRFTFADDTDREAVEGDLALAIFAAECVYGRPRVRMETRYRVDDVGRCEIDVAGESGEAAGGCLPGSRPCAWATRRSAWSGRSDDLIDRP
jgi:hypothetical protein